MLCSMMSKLFGYITPYILRLIFYFHFLCHSCLLLLIPPRHGKFHNIDARNGTFLTLFFQNARLPKIIMETRLLIHNLRILVIIPLFLDIIIQPFNLLPLCRYSALSRYLWHTLLCIIECAVHFRWPVIAIAGFEMRRLKTLNLQLIQSRAMTLNMHMRWRDVIYVI